MAVIQTGSWRKDAEGIYRVFISGPEQPEGTPVEVLARYGDPKYVMIIGKHSSIKGGNLYTFNILANQSQHRLLLVLLMWLHHRLTVLVRRLV